MSSCRSRLAPRYTVYWSEPVKIPASRPGKLTSSRAPTVFTRSEEHTSELQSRQYLPSFPPRRSSDRQQVGAAVHVVLERAGENTRVQTREAHLQPRAHGLHLAARRLVFGPYLANLLRLPGQIQVGSRAAGNHQWRVPERVPLFPLHHARRKFDMQLFQRGNLLLGKPSDAAGDFEFGGQILSEYDPVPAAFARGQFAHYRLPATNRKLGAQLFSALPLPTDFQNAGANPSL